MVQITTGSPTAYASLITRIWQVVSTGKSDDFNSTRHNVARCPVAMPFQRHTCWQAGGVHPNRQAATRVGYIHRSHAPLYSASICFRHRGPANNDARKFDYRDPVKPIILHNFQWKTLRGSVRTAIGGLNSRRKRDHLWSCPASRRLNTPRFSCHWGQFIHNEVDD